MKVDHKLRKPRTNRAREPLNYSTSRKKRDRRLNSWKETVQKKLETISLTWSEAIKIARSRREWRALVDRIADCETNNLTSTKPILIQSIYILNFSKLNFRPVFDNQSYSH